MTLATLKSYVMFQTNNDAEDVGDFVPYLTGYLNEGYDLLTMAYEGKHVSPVTDDIPAPDYLPLAEDTDVPVLPDWMHLALADYATYLVYRNGNPSKQQRGQQFRAGMDAVLTTIRSSGGKAMEATALPLKYIRNIPW